MDILVIGGTEFVGRHLVERGLDLGHKLTLFHRGKHGSDLFPQVERIHGDRDGGLAVLADRKWDAVIDTCGYVPRIVRQSAEYLKDRVDRYLFISTISVLGDPSEVNQTETSPLATVKDPNVEEITGETYGGLKVLCEQVVDEIYGSRALNVRPGMIVGPYDKTFRFPYWFQRAKKGGKILSLHERNEAVQFIDGRDLANFCYHLLDVQAHGAYFATGPEYPMTWGDIFDEAALQGGASYELIRPSLEWLDEQGVKRGKAFPSQIPSELDKPGFYEVDNTKGIQNGLKFRPLSEIIEDTLEWLDAIPAPLPTGLTPEREAELIEKYETVEV